MSKVAPRPLSFLLMLKAASLLMLVSLVGCGGGGGGGSGTGGENGVGSGPGGSFTLSGTSLSFEYDTAQSANPPPQRISMHVTGSKAAYAAAAYPPGVGATPWLDVTVEGTFPDLDFVFTIRSPLTDEGEYPTTILLGTANKHGDVLSSQQVAISLKVRDHSQIYTLPPQYIFTLGDSMHVIDSSVRVRIPKGRQFKLTSDSSWLITNSEGYGSSTMDLPLRFDSSGLSIGGHTATLTLQDLTDPSETRTEKLPISIAPPQITVSNPAIGGFEGIDSGGASLTVALNTGSNIYPFRIIPPTDPASSWLKIPTLSGSAGSAGTEVIVDADRNVVRGGRYLSKIGIVFDVQGTPIQMDVPIMFNKLADRLVVQGAGIGLAKLPSKAHLARSMPVGTTWGRTNVPWTATSDQSWLSVTPSGVTGQSMMISANANGLAPDQMYFASIRLKSSDPYVEPGPETIRVGLWVGSSDPVDVRLPISVTRMTVSPVAPFVFVHGAGATSIDVYNLFSGTKIRTLAPAGAMDLRGMAISGDGSELYVVDGGPPRILAIDPDTGVVLRSYINLLKPEEPLDDVIFARPDGRGALLANTGAKFDATNGLAVLYVPPTHSRGVASHDGRHVATLEGTYRVAWWGPDGNFFDSDYQGGVTAQSDIALSLDDASAITASRETSSFDVFRFPDGESIASIPTTLQPTNVEISAFDGMLAAGGTAGPGAPDILLFDAGLHPIGSLTCSDGSPGSYELGEDLLQVSADGFRVLCASHEVDRIAGRLGFLNVPNP